MTLGTRGDAKTVVNAINTFLSDRGLELNKDKTKLTKVVDGFEFLGFRYKHHEGRGLLVTPSPESEKIFRKKIKKKLHDNRSSNPALLIKELNPIIVG